MAPVSKTRRILRTVLTVLVFQHYCLAVTSAFSGRKASAPPKIAKTIQHPATTTSMTQKSYKRNHGLHHVQRSTQEDLEDATSNAEKDTSLEAIVVDTKELDTKLVDSGEEDASSAATRRERRIQIAATLVVSIVAMAVAAKTGILPGPLLADGSLGLYEDAMIGRDALMTGITSVLAVVLNRSISLGFQKGVYDSNMGRKLTHMLAAPLFIVTWPFFSDASGARCFAWLVALTNVYRLYLAGSGDAAESTLAKTISRSGDKSEALKGPLIYIVIFQFFILAFWRNTFPGVVAMTTMAAGDGMADIIGRRFGKNSPKWPDGKKTLVGSLAFAVSAFAVTTAILQWLVVAGSLPMALATGEMVVRVAAISCICAIVEVLPIGDDNYTVPASAAILSALWLR